MASDLYSVTVYFSDTKLIGLLFFTKSGLTTLVGSSKGVKSKNQILIKNTLVGFQGKQGPTGSVTAISTVEYICNANAQPPAPALATNTTESATNSTQSDPTKTADGLTIMNNAPGPAKPDSGFWNEFLIPATKSNSTQPVNTITTQPLTANTTQPISANTTSPQVIQPSTNTTASNPTTQPISANTTSP